MNTQKFALSYSNTVVKFYMEMLHIIFMNDFHEQINGIFELCETPLF